MKKTDVIAVALLSGALAANAGDAYVELTGLVKDKGEPIIRADVGVDGKYNSNFYITSEHSGDKNAYRIRGQVLPLEAEVAGIKIKVGATVQHLDIGNNGHQEVGGAVAAVWKPTEPILLAGSLRYFPETHELHSFAVAKAGRLTADVLQSWNMEEKTGVVRYGLNIGLTKKGEKISGLADLALRLEGKHTGRYNDMSKAYAGLGLQAKF
jgi:hypothetical protein